MKPKLGRLLCLAAVVLAGMTFMMVQAQPLGRGQGGQGRGLRRQQMMNELGWSEDQLARCRMMMHVSIDPFDPNAVLGAKENLALTPAQVGKLEAIVKEARDQARAALNDEQKAILQKMPASPATMTEMHQRLCVAAQTRPAGAGRPAGMGRGMMNCPIWCVIQDEAQPPGPATQPAK